MPNDNISLSPAFERNNVPVVMASSNQYAPYAGVLIQSILDHAGEENNYDIIIMEREISQENKRLLTSLAAGRPNVSIRYCDPSPLFVSFHYVDEEHPWPLETYFRIVAPYVLSYPGRIITVGVDTLLRTDIARLMDEDLEGRSVGGVCDVIGIGMYLCNRLSFTLNINLRDYFSNVCGFGLDDIKNSVNADLLLIDCDQYVQELELNAILSAARQGKYVVADQDILNVLMKGKIKLLDLSWNVAVRATPRSAKLIDAVSKLYGGAYELAYENPCLLHWVGKPKPWVCPDVPWGSEWWQTALRTPFVGHIIARMTDEQEKRRAYYRKRYGKENVDVWDPAPKGIDRT